MASKMDQEWRNYYGGTGVYPRLYEGIGRSAILQEPEFNKTSEYISGAVGDASTLVVELQVIS